MYHLISKTVLGPVLALVMALGVGHCNSGCATFDSVNKTGDDKVLQDCREQGRKAKALGASDYSAADVYYRCTEDAGLRK